MYINLSTCMIEGFLCYEVHVHRLVIQLVYHDHMFNICTYDGTCLHVFCLFRKKPQLKPVEAYMYVHNTCIVEATGCSQSTTSAVFTLYVA